MQKLKFKTTINIPVSKSKINHKDKILLLGSCFSEHIGEQLNIHGFDTTINPAGIMYNVFSICKSIRYGLQRTAIKKDEIHYNNTTELYYHFDFHSSLSRTAIESTVTVINDSIASLHGILPSLDWLILTLGSSFVYDHKSDGTVANCHKVPNTEFSKKMLSIDEQISTLSTTIEQLKSVNRGVKILLTISPVRHIKEGLINNSLSKSNLRVVCSALSSSIADVYYFPAYEIVVDDLRDYRFYRDDLIHPNDMAVNYIWKCFSDTFFDQDTMRLNDAISQINAEINHRYFNPNAMQSIRHKNILTKKIDKLINDYPFLNRMFPRE